jgi:hypothetical protein
MALLFPLGAYDGVLAARLIAPLEETYGTFEIASLNISMAANPSFNGSSTINQVTSS